MNESKSLNSNNIITTPNFSYLDSEGLNIEISRVESSLQDISKPLGEMLRKYADARREYELLVTERKKRINNE